MPQSPISKSKVPFFAAPSFQEHLKIQVRINKMVNQQCQLPPYSFRINLNDTSSHIPIDLLGLYLVAEYLSNILSKLYIPPLLGRVFTFMLFRLLENAFASQKIESRNFYSCTRQVKFLSSPPRKREITHSTQAIAIF